MLVFLSSGFVVGLDGSLRVPDEQRLLNRVFRANRYDNSIRPVFNATTSVMVKFGLTLIQIMDMEEKNQVLITNVWLEHEWRDERIKWNPKDYNNLRVLRVPASKLWLPDIVLYNNADDFTTGYMPSNAMVHDDGTVFWSPPARLRSSCKIDITLFPFDIQECTLKFGSWTYDQAQVDIVQKSDSITSPHYITNGEWALLNTNMKRNEVIYPISPAVYPDITITILINRRILYYILNIILPCVWLNILSLLAFCLPPDAGEKITLGITVLLSYSVFMLLVADSMPATSEFVPLIGRAILKALFLQQCNESIMICRIYLTLSMAMTSISVILTVGVLKLHHCSPHQTKVPNWIRTCVLKGLGRLVRCRCIRVKHNHKKNKYPKIRGNFDNADVCLRLVNEGINGRMSPLFRSSCDHDSRARDQDITEEGSLRLQSELAKEYKELSLLKEILRYIQILVSKKDEEEEEVEVMNEWREVAQVIDRFLFLLFLTVTMSTTLVLVVFIPYI
uniref:Neurotransmitter-gated ion-channel ligand-binding domain-containing protein n=1 Tax=Capitella teleta TaxID=283909 RepID=X2B6Z0_CAPTE